jgi:hypothetical protein
MRALAPGHAAIIARAGPYTAVTNFEIISSEQEPM